MKKISKRLNTRKSAQLLFFAFFIFSHVVFSQQADGTKAIDHVGGAVTVTNNGISLLPTFSLGKPAMMFDLNVGNKRLTFEPQFRFSLQGKPWSFIFWWRYKLLQNEKFKMTVGAHPSVIFRPMTTLVNGVPHDDLVAHRYLATEIAPNYFITKDISVGIYYLHSNGLDEGTTKSTHFVTVNSNFSRIKLSEQFYMKFNPQVYYLKMDELDGFYVTATVTLAKKNFPLTLQSIMNQAIETDIPAKKDFVWNVSLIYSFNQSLVKSKT